VTLRSIIADKIGYVSQKAVLFSGTIESNIKYANENARVGSAHYAEIAQATDIIKESDQVWIPPCLRAHKPVWRTKTEAAIARALAKKPEIYIFDDSLSALISRPIERSDRPSRRD